jgi:adenylate cyclase
VFLIMFHLLRAAEFQVPPWFPCGLALRKMGTVVISLQNSSHARRVLEADTLSNSGRMKEKNGAAFETGAQAAKHRKRRALQLFIVSLATLLAIGLLSQLPAWKLFDLRLFDYISTFRHQPLPDTAPIIVAIDEPSLSDINIQWPWPRSLHARLVSRLRAAGAKAIGLDIIFAEPSTEDNDAALAKVLGPDVVLAADETLIQSPQSDQLVRTEPLKRFTDAGALSGIASITLERDGIFRSMPFYADGFATRLAQAAGLTYPPADDRLIQWPGPARTYPTVSYYQALDPENMLPPGFFKDRIVLVGLSLQNAADLNDKVSDAFATSYTVHTGQLVSGVEIQAAILDNLTRNLSIGHPGQAAQLPLLLLVVLAAAIVSWQPLSWMNAMAAVSAVVALVGMSYFALTFGRIFISPLAPAAAYFITAAGQTALDYIEERHNRKQIIRAFSQYLSPALVQRLAQDPSQLRLGGERRTLSILFCDVRGFTTISEELRNDPEQLTSLINRLLTPLSDTVLKHNGTIDKYIGDCVMAFWNAPLDDPDHALHAVSAAVEMLDATKRLNLELAEEARIFGRPPRVLQIGIGVNTGECVVGNMGSARRFDYSALGDSVNLASRLEGQSKNYGAPLLIGEQTAMAVAGSLNVVELDRIRVKGRSELSPVFTVVKALSDNQRRMHEAFLAASYAGAALPETGEQPVPELETYYQLVRSRQNAVSA